MLVVQHRRVVGWFGVGVLVLGLAAMHATEPCAAQTGTHVDERAKTPGPATLDETARLIGVESEVAKLKAYARGGVQADRWQILWLHEHISERITSASLQVDATIAQIDNEISRAQEIGSYLSDRRDRSVNRANLFGILVGGGLGAVSSGFQFSSSLNKPAASVGIAAGTASAGFGLAGIHAQRGETAKFEFDSNMLAEFFDRPVLEDSHYPETIETFLNGLPQSHAEGLTRKQELIATWIRVRRIDALESRDKIDRLTSRPEDQLKLTIDDLGDRAAMLQDVRARISYLKRDLGELLASLPEVDSGLPGLEK
jgi:hypothetical protein